jgi:hypothetical protein
VQLRALRRPLQRQQLTGYAFLKPFERSAIISQDRRGLPSFIGKSSDCLYLQSLVRISKDITAEPPCQ